MMAKQGHQTRPVLIIDNEPDFCDMVRLLLTVEGFRVVSAHDGLSGIELAQKAQPAVILLDIIMPDLDGVSTCQRLKQDPVLRHIPVVGITASPEVQYTQQAFGAGAEFFLAKPFGRESLLQVVKLAVQRIQRKPNRRGHSRYPANLPVRCIVPTDKEAAREVIGRTGNVSLDGLLLLLPETLAAGAVVRLQLRLHEGIVTIHVNVVWQGNNEVDDHIIPHGVHVLRFRDEADLAQYTRYVGQIGAGWAY